MTGAQASVKLPGRRFKVLANSFRKEVDFMNYAVLIKTVVDANGKTNCVEKVPMMEAFSTISLESMYKLCECELVEIKDMPLQLVEFDGELGIIPAVTLVFDEEFLLKHENPVANELASAIYGYGRMHEQCLCGNVLLCNTKTRKATACRSVRAKQTPL
jgi:hypothetical protein